MRFLLVLMVASLLFMTNSFAAKDGKTLYKKCRGCHGIDGKHIPFEQRNGILAGREKIELELIINAIHDGNYKDGKLNKIMQKVIRKFSPEEIVIVSEYISRFKN
jgi:cytochrome c553